ncbi:MAG: DeoR/GlpR family DNA-binding transcription regulator [Clostridia bacterium]
MELSISERKNRILEMLHSDGKVKVNELSRIFNVSEVTIRYDLTGLEEEGMLSRVYGGAVSSYKNYFNMNFKQRSNTNEAEKKAIVECVAGYINDGETVMMNSGTTTLFALHAMKSKKHLNIVTNSIAIATEAGEYEDFNVILLGGTVNTRYQFTSGNDALLQLSSYHADKLILSVDGVSMETGLTTYYQQEKEICLQMIRQSNTTIIAADYTKIGRTAFVKIAKTGMADHIVTNTRALGSEIENLKAEGIDVILV